MLKLSNIVKDYTVGGDTVVNALKGVSLEFREHELVAILGPSGCGKTTLLNIIGGLDNYTDGDLIINGTSTKKYKDPDWDAYRNHSIGFVFQSYNLIPHQSVLANVELALTLSGVPKSERRRRAAEALKMVGLGDQLKKRPSQMSGGQMQRVAIARALVNDPDILLADEPTGALDSETSVQLMEILKDISTRKLIIMVTHNPELAERYATRIVRVLDGNILSDSNPVTEEERAELEANDIIRNVKKKKRGKKADKKPSMSFFTALSLSLNNLMTKKARTFLTSFAGSIGIIGIALILALSNGVQNYIDRVQEDTLSSYPITIEAESVDMGALMSSIMGVSESAAEEKTDEELGDKVYSSAVMYEMVNALNSAEMTHNNLAAFRDYLETPDADGKRPLDELATAIRYDYNVDLNVFTTDSAGKIVNSDTDTIMTAMMQAVYGSGGAVTGGGMAGGGMMSSSYSSMMSGFDIWEEMLAPADTDESGYLVNELLREQYDVIYGDWPRKANEIVLVVDKNNTVSDMVLYALGFYSTDEMEKIMSSAMAGEALSTEIKSWTFEEICKTPLKMIPACDRYSYNAATESYTDLMATETGLQYLYSSAEELKIAGIIRANKDAAANMMTGYLGYTSELSEKVIKKTAESDIVKAQLADTENDIILGLPFKSSVEENIDDASRAAAVREFLKGAEESVRGAAYVDMTAMPSDEYIAQTVQAALAQMNRQMVEEALIAAFAQQMQTGDLEAVRGYIVAMDDATLFGYMGQMLGEKYSREYSAGVRAELEQISISELAARYDTANFSDAAYLAIYDEYMPGKYSEADYESNLKTLGYIDIDSPATMNIYAATFADKEAIGDVIAAYNETVEEADQISYVDYVALLMSSITTIINAISYILMAFVSISLVVSSIMIGIITYISVLERTKEIGILRAIGASKKDISRVFNAETLIVGFGAGAIGIGFTLLICIPVNIIIRKLTEISILGASLPLAAGVILVVISMVLTLIAGLLPSRIAAKKDPVEALRSE